MRSALVAVSACAILLVALALPVAAGPAWCEEDPVYAVNTNTVDITTSFAAQYAPDVEGPISFVLQVPSNAPLTAVVSMNGAVPVQGYVAKTLPAYYGLGGVPAVLTVWMDAESSFATYTKITGVTALSGQYSVLSTVAGTSTSVQQLSFWLPLP